MAEGLWDCDSSMAEGLAQRADEDPVGLVQSSDMFLLWDNVYICMYVSSSPTDRQLLQAPNKNGRGFWRLEGHRSSGEDTASNKRGKGRARGSSLVLARVSVGCESHRLLTASCMYSCLSVSVSQLNADGTGPGLLHSREKYVQRYTAW